MAYNRPPRRGGFPRYCMMKKFLKFVAILGVLAAAGAGAIPYFTSGMVASAARFFAAIQPGDLDGANRQQ